MMTLKSCSTTDYMQLFFCFSKFERKQKKTAPIFLRSPIENLGTDSNGKQTDVFHTSDDLSSIFTKTLSNKK